MLENSVDCYKFNHKLKSLKFAASKLNVFYISICYNSAVKFRVLDKLSDLN